MQVGTFGARVGFGSRSLGGIPLARPTGAVDVEAKAAEMGSPPRRFRRLGSELEARPGCRAAALESVREDSGTDPDLVKEVRRRTNVVGVLLNRRALLRLAGALLSEQNDQWATSSRYMSLEIIAQTLDGAEPQNENPDQEALAIPA